MYYFTENKAGMNSVSEFTTDRVHEIIKMNKNGEKPDNFTEFIHLKIEETTPDYDNVVGQDDLTRFDKVYKKKKSKKRNNNKRNNRNKNKAKNLTNK